MANFSTWACIRTLCANRSCSQPGKCPFTLIEFLHFNLQTADCKVCKMHCAFLCSHGKLTSTHLVWHMPKSRYGRVAHSVSYRLLHPDCFLTRSQDHSRVLGTCVHYCFYHNTQLHVHLVTIFRHLDNKEDGCREQRNTKFA